MTALAVALSFHGIAVALALLLVSSIIPAPPPPAPAVEMVFLPTAAPQEPAPASEPGSTNSQAPTAELPPSPTPLTVAAPDAAEPANQPEPLPRPKSEEPQPAPKPEPLPAPEPVLGRKLPVPASAPAARGCCTEEGVNKAGARPGPPGHDPNTAGTRGQCRRSHSSQRSRRPGGLRIGHRGMASGACGMVSAAQDLSRGGPTTWRRRDRGGAVQHRPLWPCRGHHRVARIRFSHPGCRDGGDAAECGSAAAAGDVSRPDYNFSSNTLQTDGLTRPARARETEPPRPRPVRS